jgi:hypothetical protein
MRIRQLLLAAALVASALTPAIALGGPPPKGTPDPGMVTARFPVAPPRFHLDPPDPPIIKG